MIRSFKLLYFFSLFLWEVILIYFISLRYILAYSCTGAFGKAKPASHSKAMAAEPSQSRATQLDSSSKKRRREPAEALGDARPSTARHVHVRWSLRGEVDHSSSSGPPTPDFGNMDCTGPPCWQVGEDYGGLSNSF
jgi:hypothetical protein